jgi:hypothetical protein
MRNILGKALVFTQEIYAFPHEFSRLLLVSAHTTHNPG